MRIDLLPVEQWESLNADLAQLLAVPDNLTIRAYPGLAPAIYEVATGLAQFYMHKRHAGFIKGWTPAFDFLMPLLYKDGFQMQTLDVQASYDEWLSALKPETSFVMFAEDNPVSGEIYPKPQLAQSLQDKKIFALKVSHSHWLRQAKTKNWQLQPHEILLASVSPDLTILISGPRFKAPPLSVHKTFWDRSLCLEKTKSAIQKFTEDKTLIQRFESQLPSGWKPLLSTDERIFDRSVIYNSSLNSESVLSEFTVPHSALESTSLCQWNAQENFYSWWGPAPAEGVLRGGLVLGVDVVGSPNTLEKLKTISENARL